VQVLQLQAGAFPEYECLNPAFRRGSPKLRYILDTNLDNAPLGRVHSLDLNVFLPVFHRLSAHSCGSGVVGADTGGGCRHEPSDTIVTLRDRIDIAHYLEHLVLDIQYDLGPADSISGVTIGLGDGGGRFLTVVESADHKLCVFAVNAALAMMHQALYTGALDPRYRLVIELARWARSCGTHQIDAAVAAEVLQSDPATACYCLVALEVLGFPIQIAGESLPPAHLGQVLVVEDNEDGRALLADGLAALGYEVRCAPDGVSGVGILSQYRTNVVVLDVYLPGVDGLSIARWLLETQPATRLVLISGGIEVDEGANVANPAIRFLSKPFRIGDLHAALTRS
jgi:CheY-like chemotaxis protein